jgi:uncharacterized protein (DUF486 family)
MSNWFGVIGLLIIPGLFYTAASFFHLRYPDWPIWGAIGISIAFASCEYIFRIPAIKKAHNEIGFSNVQIQMTWIGVTLVMAFISQWFTPLPTKDPVQVMAQSTTL